MNEESKAKLLAAVSRDRSLFGKNLDRVLADERAPLDFDRCLDWLSMRKIRKTVNSKLGNSLYLKHVIERYYEQWVSGCDIHHEALLAAILHLEIPYRITRNNRNCIDMAIGSKLPDPEVDRPVVPINWWRYLTETESGRASFK